MSNEMTLALFHSEWGIQNDDYLQHYGILGMHWGIRRYQPYGEGGYDPDHEGKNIGLAARLAGHTGSYSDAIKRGSSFGNRAKAAASSLGKRAGRAASEAAERFNYASERTAQGILNAGKKARSGLAKYAGGKYDSEAARIYENAGASALAKGVFSRFSSDAKTKVSDLKRASFDDVKSALGSGASKFQDALSRTLTSSKEFGRNAAMAAALFGGALDPKNEGFTKVQAKSDVASGLSGKSSSLYSGWYEHQSRMNPGQRLTEIMNGGRSQWIHGDAMDLAGRLASNKYGALSKTGRDMFKNKHNTRPMINLQESGPDRSSFKTYDPRSAIRMQMLTDLGYGRSLGKNRGALSRQSSYDAARQRDLIRSAGSTGNNGLFEIGDRINVATGETVKKGDKPFKNRRQYIGSSDSGYGGDSRYDLNNGLSKAREILLQPMSVKNPHRQAFNVNDLDRAKSTVDRLFKDMENAEDIRKMKGIHADPYIARTLGIGRK